MLATSGIYGVVFYAVTQRRHEFGIRRALGASSLNLLKLAMGEGFAVCLVGVGVGVGAASWLTRLIASQLYGVTPMDPITVAVVGIGLMGVTLVACCLPALLVNITHPAAVLRAD